MANEKFNIYEKITNDFIAALSKDIVPWHQPWFGRTWAVSRTNGKPYSFLNQMLLGKDGEWLTFKQIEAEGGTIKKGCKAHYVVFWKFLSKYAEDENGEQKVVSQFPILKFYNVWHISETEGIKPKYEVHKPHNENEHIETAHKIYCDYFAREKESGLWASVQTFNHEACYSPKRDCVTLPDITLFENSEEFYATAFHEMTHSTGAEKRLNRDGIVKFDHFGSEKYSKEELIAEIGSAFLCNQAELDPEKTFANSQAYVKGWLKVLKNDPKMVVLAASKAEQAAHYILTGEKPKHESEE